MHAYRVSIELMRSYPFSALIMAAMMKADTDNAALLATAFPDLWAELNVRYNSPGGAITESEYQALRRMASKQAEKREALAVAEKGD